MPYARKDPITFYIYHEIIETQVLDVRGLFHTPPVSAYRWRTAADTALCTRLCAFVAYGACFYVRSASARSNG